MTEQTKVEEHPVLSNEAYLDTFNAVMKNRVEKMRQFEERGIEVYETGCNPSHRAADLQREHGSKDHETLESEGVRVEVAGRLMAVRVFGKASFAKLKDATGSIQLHVRKDLLGEELYATYKKFDMGDIVWASGVLFMTNTGELTVRCETIKLLTKSLRPLPEKFHGLTDVESRLRQRYLDLMVNDDVREVFYKRSTIIRDLRTLMTDRGFLEVETPMMHVRAGGAAAKPFKTHHNALSMDMYLRVAPELYLKRLIVGGFERVFELNRNFRNEGLSRRHNPEFTMMEFYMAYGTYLDLMDFIEDLVCELSQMSIGTKVWQWNGHEIDINGPWKRLRIREGVAEKLGVSEDRLSDREFLKEQAAKLPEPVRGGEADRMSNGHLLMAIFEQLLEETLIQPTFVYEFPASVSPLARRSKENPEFVERFEIYAGGIELGNAFSELNDAFDQRQRFLDQIEAKLAGDEEAHPMDDDYVKALEFGMPPCAGLGLGIDRLIMMMTSSESIRDVILFPMMRPEQ